ncbi:hypothetical protein BDV12DRAFT_176318 [Aspergillus spectabilis]
MTVSISPHHSDITFSSLKIQQWTVPNGLRLDVSLRSSSHHWFTNSPRHEKA